MDMPKKVKDPVCGMEVDESTEFKSHHMGETYYFCSDNCRKEFEKAPHKYIHGH